MANETGEAGAPGEPIDPATIGLRVRRIRRSRGKNLDVIAGLVGISAVQLSRLETGQRSLDRLSLIVRLANALEVAPSELTRLPVPTPGNGGMDSATAAVSRAIRAVNHDLPGGEVLPVEALRQRVGEAIDAYSHDGRVREAGAALPGLIRDLHREVRGMAYRAGLPV